MCVWTSVSKNIEVWTGRPSALFFILYQTEYEATEEISCQCIARISYLPVSPEISQQPIPLLKLPSLLDFPTHHINDTGWYLPAFRRGMMITSFHGFGYSLAVSYTHLDVYKRQHLHWLNIYHKQTLLYKINTILILF